MFSKPSCCCWKSENKMETTTDVTTGGFQNKSYDTWEPFPHTQSSSIAANEEPKSSPVAVVHQPKLSKSSRSSLESIKLSKIDLNLDLFEDTNRFFGYVRKLYTKVIRIWINLRVPHRQ
ncbi:uncharacterized protein LOC119606558 isoform X1 [Lucilia sericata]|uniref:uncharacterized protein LOC119606558 isoform X1 n=1 Tax=Lucilia sericata TaxID=13632 RepID=UPI0018A82841|nr:uncharacterized protein LOC119606558 isoform X1 [Lucilia sericata]